MNHAEVEAEFAAAVTDPARPPPSLALSPRGDVDARRFAVYRNNVHVGLVGALRAKFPVTARLVGDEFFTAMARVFVGIEKPNSPLLALYGDGFPDFIAGFAPARTVPYLADVARLECAWMDAYHAAEAAPLGIGALSAMAPGDLLELVLVPHPATRLVASNHPVGSIWSANQTAAVEPLRTHGPEAVLITRPDADVVLRTITVADRVFSAGLLAGTSVGEAAGAALEAAPEFDLGTALVGLISTGAFAGILTEGRAS